VPESAVLLKILKILIEGAALGHDIGFFVEAYMTFLTGPFLLHHYIHSSSYPSRPIPASAVLIQPNPTQLSKIQQQPKPTAIFQPKDKPGHTPI